MREMKLDTGVYLAIRPSYEWPEDVRALGVSHRELEVLALLIEGHNNKEAAAILGIQYQSVKNHWHSLSKKLRANNLGQALVMLMFKKVVSIQYKLGEGRDFLTTPEQFVEGIRKILSDENRTVSEKSKQAAKDFLVKHGIYAEMFEERAKELKKDG